MSQRTKNRAITPSRGALLTKNPLVYTFVFLLAGLILLGGFLAHVEAEKRDLRMRAEVEQVVADVKASLGSRLYWNVHRTEGVKALVAMNPQLTQEDFARAMEINFSGEHDLRNIGLAKGMVIHYMYPIEGNEAAIGLDFTKNEAQFPTADLARRQNKTVIAGPLNLVQGGVGIIARIPIYLEDKDHYPGGFWGLASAVIDMDVFYEECGLNSLPPHVRLAIRGKDATGSQGEVFWGDAEVFSLQPITADLALPYGSWQIAAVPSGGWSTSFFHVTLPVVLYCVIALLLLFTNFFMIIFYDRLRLAEAEAQRLNKAKSEFLANMSHEIRTPLNGVVGFLELLQLSRLDPEQAEYVRDAKGAAGLLLGLINDILDFSKIEAGKLDLEQVEFNLRSVVDEIVALMRRRATDKGLALQVVIGTQVPETVRGDPSRLKQVLGNLVGNAVKFTAAGTVTITLDCPNPANDGETALIHLAVTDTGIGISPEALAGLFRPFTQADASTTRKFGGTGLGLAISKELVTLMGGEIGASSQLGEGSQFSLRLPLPVVKATQERSPTQGTLVGPDLQLEGGTPGKRKTEFPSGLNILLAEDNEINARIVIRLLATQNLHCDVVTDGEQAYQVATTKNYDLIFMDCQMPEVDGYVSTMRIREWEGNRRHTPIVALTAHAMEGDREKCLASGMDDYLSKPLYPDDFFTVIARFTEQTAGESTSEGWLDESGAGQGADSSIAQIEASHEIAGPTTDDFADEGSVDYRDIADYQQVFADATGLSIAEAAELFLDFSVYLPGVLREIEEALAGADMAAVARLAHKIKGSAGTLRLQEIADPARRLEEYCRLQFDEGMDARSLFDKLCQAADSIFG